MSHGSLTIDIDSGFYTVKFDSVLLKDAVVEADCIIPPLREDDLPSSDSDLDDAEYGDNMGYAKGVLIILWIKGCAFEYSLACFLPSLLLIHVCLCFTVLHNSCGLRC